jgi:dephospho-CoA kinase
MIKVGLTGGIGSGKSTVARILRVLDVPVFGSDAVGKEILANDPIVRKAVVARFGEGIYPGGEVDRSALATIVFHDASALKDLNAIIHPAVRNAFATWMGDQVTSYAVMEAAILADSGGYKAFDRIIVVSAPEELRIQRVLQRDKVERGSVIARMANQVGEQERLRIADHVVQNDDHQLVIPQVLAIHRELLELASA